MNREEIEQQIVEIIAEQLNIKVDTVNHDDSLEDDLGMDDLDMVELVMSLEDKFGHDVDDDTDENWKVVKDISEWVAGKEGL